MSGGDQVSGTRREYGELRVVSDTRVPENSGSKSTLLTTRALVGQPLHPPVRTEVVLVLELRSPEGLPSLVHKE